MFRALGPQEADEQEDLGVFLWSGTGKMLAKLKMDVDMHRQPWISPTIYLLLMI